MKKSLLVTLALAVTSQVAVAQHRDRDRGPVVIPGNRMDLTQCIKTLHNAETTISDLKLQLSQCRPVGPGRPGPGREIIERLERENEMLRRESESSRRDVIRLSADNSRLSIDNTRLLSDNRRQQDEIFDLRRQLDDLRGPRTQGYFSYAGCKTSNGSVNNSYLAAATGIFPIESEANAQMEVAKTFSCSWGVGVAKTEEIRTEQEVNYCVAGCATSNGTVNTAYIVGARGRNQAEAEFKAMKAVAAKYSCSWGIKVQNCQ